jgi:hypothetical protein
MQNMKNHITWFNTKPHMTQKDELKSVPNRVH